MTDFAKLVLDADTRGLKRGQRELDKTGDVATRTATRIDGSANGIARSLVKVGGAFGAAFAASGALRQIISTNAEFGASIQRVAAISGATGEELNKLRQSALDMGAATQFSASQAADALGFLAMAGFNASEAVAAIPSVLDLAAASGMELAQAADIASNVLSGFGKEAEDAAEVSDVLAKAASSTNTSVGQLGQAMSTAAPIAKAMGVSMQETAAAIGVMSDAGIQGERAGTALRAVFASLAGPTKQATDALAKYGLTASDIDPALVGLGGAMKTLGEAGISTADAMAIFGREAASGALVMADAADRIADLTDEFENADGAAADMAKTMRDNLQGDIDQMKSALESVTISLGDSGMTGALRTAAQVGTSALRVIAENMGTLTRIVGAATVAWVSYRATLLATSAVSALMTSRIALQTAAMITSTTAIGGMASAKLALGVAVTGVTGAFRALTAALIANPFTAVAVAVGTLAAAMYTLRDSQRAARAETNQLIGSLKGLAQARSADFALKRNEAQQELNRLRSERTSLEIQRDRLLERRSISPSGVQTYTPQLRELNAELARTGLQIVGVESKISLADKAFKDAGDAAKAMEAPIMQTAGAVGGLSESLEGAGKSAGKARDQFADLMETLYPENTTRRQMEQLRQIEQFGDKISNVADARRRALGVDKPAPISFDQGPLKEAKMVEDAAERVSAAFAKQSIKAQKQSVLIARSFREMAQDVIGSLQGMADAIKNGGFFDILTSVLNVGLQLAGAGAFGSNIQNNVNSVSGARANGGQVNAGRSYLVGEKGPELFTPSGHGRIHSNDNSGGTLTVRLEQDGGMTAYMEGVAAQVVSTAAPALVSAGGQAGVRRMQKIQGRRLG